jgi:hypothetical protein
MNCSKREIYMNGRRINQKKIQVHFFMCHWCSKCFSEMPVAIVDIVCSLVLSRITIASLRKKGQRPYITCETTGFTELCCLPPNGSTNSRLTAHDSLLRFARNDITPFAMTVPGSPSLISILHSLPLPVLPAVIQASCL